MGELAAAYINNQKQKNHVVLATTLHGEYCSEVEDESSEETDVTEVSADSTPEIELKSSFLKPSCHFSWDFWQKKTLSKFEPDFWNE